MPNSWHKAVNDFPGRVAATTNLTFCSSTSIVFHDILYTPPLATLSRECKGCPETFCKGCHETEHRFCLGGDFSLWTAGLQRDAWASRAPSVTLSEHRSFKRKRTRSGDRPGL